MYFIWWSRGEMDNVSFFSLHILFYELQGECSSKHLTWGNERHIIAIYTCRSYNVWKYEFISTWRKVIVRWSSQREYLWKHNQPVSNLLISDHMWSVSHMVGWLYGCWSYGGCQICWSHGRLIIWWVSPWRSKVTERAGSHWADNRVTLSLAFTFKSSSWSWWWWWWCWWWLWLWWWWWWWWW